MYLFVKDTIPCPRPLAPPLPPHGADGGACACRRRACPLAPWPAHYSLCPSRPPPTCSSSSSTGCGWLCLRVPSSRMSASSLAGPGSPAEPSRWSRSS